MTNDGPTGSTSWTTALGGRATISHERSCSEEDVCGRRWVAAKREHEDSCLAEHLTDSTIRSLMSLCLMLATKSHVVKPPLDVHPSRVVTQHALETFPFRHYAAMRAQHNVEYKDTFAGSGQPRQGVPKLSKLAAFQFLRSPTYSRRMIERFFGTVAEDKLRNIKPFYFVAENDDMRPAHDRDLRSRWTRVERSAEAVTWRKRYLTGCSLVVMPSILIPQWKKQISEHFEPGTFEVEVVDNTKLKAGQDRIPPIKRLVQLDVSSCGLKRTSPGLT